MADSWQVSVAPVTAEADAVEASGWSVQVPVVAAAVTPIAQVATSNDGAWTVAATAPAVSQAMPETAQHSWAAVASQPAICPPPPSREAAPATASTNTAEQQAWALFEHAVKSIFESWTSLRLAIENNWGGGGFYPKGSLLCGQLCSAVQESSRGGLHRA